MFIFSYLFNLFLNECSIDNNIIFHLLSVLYYFFLFINNYSNNVIMHTRHSFSSEIIIKVTKTLYFIYIFDIEQSTYFFVLNNHDQTYSLSGIVVNNILQVLCINVLTRLYFHTRSVGFRIHFVAYLSPPLSLVPSFNSLYIRTFKLIPAYTVSHNNVVLIVAITTTDRRTIKYFKKFEHCAYKYNL